MPPSVGLEELQDPNLNILPLLATHVLFHHWSWSPEAVKGAVARLAEQGDPAAFKLPRPLLHSGNLDFSFAGLKTAVLVQSQRMVAAAGAARFEDLPRQAQADLAASTQAARNRPLPNPTAGLTCAEFPNVWR